MKNLEQIKKQIDSLFKEAKEYKGEDVEKVTKRIKLRIDFLNKCALYLETNPRQEFIEKMKQDLLDKKSTCDSLILSVGSLFSNMEQIKQEQNRIKSETNYGAISKQLSMINYILSDIVA